MCLLQSGRQSVAWFVGFEQKEISFIKASMILAEGREKGENLRTTLSKMPPGSPCLNSIQFNKPNLSSAFYTESVFFLDIYQVHSMQKTFFFLDI